jgi:DNA-binding NtrC family response regulator
MLAKKILVVDDEESIRKTFVLLLSEKYRVVAAKDAEEALDKQKNGYDLIIADLRLPGKDGVELVTEMRRRGYRGEVILISAHAELVDPSILSRLRIGHFFAKPLELDAISRSIDYLLTKNEAAVRA